MHRCVNSIPQEWRGLRYRFHMHTHDRTPVPQSSRIHSKNCIAQRSFPIQALCRFHTSLAFRFLCHQSLVWVVFFFVLNFFLPPIHLKWFLEKIHLAVVHAHAFLVIPRHAHSHRTPVRTNGQHTGTPGTLHPHSSNTSLERTPSLHGKSGPGETCGATRKTEGWRQESLWQLVSPGRSAGPSKDRGHGL